MRIVGFLTTAFLIGTASFALAQELPTGYGTTMPNGSKVSTTLINGSDVDDYVFSGYPGQQAEISLKLPKKTQMNASLVLIRPDGTRVAEGDANLKLKTGKTITIIVQEQDPDTGDSIDVEKQVPQVLKVKYKLDQLGTWKVRIDIPDKVLPTGDSGEYTVAVKYNAPPKTKINSPDETQPSVYQFRVAAQGGAALKFKFAFKSGNAVLNGIRAPNGEFVDVGSKLKTKNNKFVKANKVEIPADFPRGDYEIAFNVADGAVLTKTKFTASIKLPDAGKKRKGKLDANEPLIAGTPAPAVGGGRKVVLPGGSTVEAGTRISVNVLNAFDSAAPQDPPAVYLNNFALVNVTTSATGSATTVTGTVPSSITDGTFDFVVETSRGQVAVKPFAFTVVPPPKVSSVDPTVGSVAGGYEVTIVGAGFPDNVTDIGLLIDGSDVPVKRLRVTPTSFTFVAPGGRSPTPATFGVTDLRSQLQANLPVDSFAFLATPGISRVIPGLVPVLGGDDLFVKGTNFRPTDQLFMETEIPGEFVEIPGTYVDANLHAFAAPIRPKGAYEIFVRDENGERTPGLRTVSYFRFADFTPETGLANPPVDDLRDAWSTTLADFDNDGDEDLFLAKQGTGSRGQNALIQVFVNDGTGALTDESDIRIPAPSATDDWRADRIWLSDITQDGFDDIVITTNSTSVPAGNASHTRILVSTKRSSSSPASDRVFVNRTLDLMAAPRNGKSGVSSTSGDNWRGLDMWIGDVDLGPAGPPEILITHQDLKEEIDVLCGNYCSSNIGGALYRFYWGGSRAFVWDAKARNGQGQYRFEHNFFPRKSGVLVPIGNPPPGVIIRGCNNSTPCRNTFTPFTGHSIEAVDIDADRKPDVVVLSDMEVENADGTTSSTQVGLNFFDQNAGSLITDVTDEIFALGGLTTGQELGIGLFGFPDGNSYGTIIVTQRAAPTSGAVGMRMIKYRPMDPTTGAPFGFDDITAETIPSASFGEAWQASALDVLDVDSDGDQDLVLVADAAPSVGVPAIRILRNVIEGGKVGILRDEFAGLINNVAGGGADPLDGTSLAVGDLDGDGAAEFVVTRSVIEGDDTQTRTMTTDQ